MWHWLAEAASAGTSKITAEWITVAFTLALAVATGYLARFTWKLADESEKSRNEAIKFREEAVKTRKATMQPLLYVRARTLHPYDGAASGLTLIGPEDDGGLESSVNTFGLRAMVCVRLRIKNVGSGAALELRVLPTTPGAVIRTVTAALAPGHSSIVSRRKLQQWFYPEPLKSGEQRKWSVELLYLYSGKETVEKGTVKPLNDSRFSTTAGLRIRVEYKDLFGNDGWYETGIGQNKAPNINYPATFENLKPVDRSKKAPPQP